MAEELNLPESTLNSEPPATDEQADQPSVSEQNDPLAEDTELQKAFYDLYLECCGEDRYPRLIEVKEVKQAENYWAGRQYYWWSESEQTWKPITTPGGGVNQGGFDIEDMPRYEFVTNIYQARGLMVIGAGVGAPPRYRFFPDDADDPRDIETAANRTKLAKLIQRWNPIQKLLQDEYYHAYTGGFIALWSRYVADGDKYGVDSVSTLDEGKEDVGGATINCPQCGWTAPADEAVPPIPCPQCGAPLTQENIQEEEPIPVPMDGGEQEVPKGRQLVSAFGALNFKRPQCTNDQSEWHYCAIEKEIHYCKLRKAFPDKADQLKPGLSFGSDDVFERNARLSIAANTKLTTQTGAAQTSLATFAWIWFRPDAFYMLKSKDLRERALQMFPRGVRCEFAGQVYCQSEAESMDDAIISCHALPGRGQHRNAIGTSMLSVQDRTNTLANISMETYEYGIPITYRASDTFASEANEDQRAAPGLEVEVFVQPGSDIRQKLMQVRADSVSPDMQKHMMDLMGPVADEMTGSYPALTGAAQNQPETLGQQSMQRDAAMGRQGIFYINLKQAHADLMTISCRSLEKHADGTFKIPIFGASGDFESETVDVTASDGEAEAYPEGDENFPELWNQQRSTFMQVMDTPYGQALIQDPSNAELGIKLIGIQDLKVPKIDSWHKQLREIAELTKIPEGDAILGPIAPMVEVDPETDNHPTEMSCCKWWLNSDQGQKLKRDNEPGWQAVKAHMLQHQAAIPQPTPEQKPLSETFSTAFKDLPPAAKIQALAQVGIHINEQDLVAGAMLDKLSKPQPKPPVMAGPAPHEAQTGA